MTAATHVALIRGINVGGKNVVRMADLRSQLDAVGLGPSVTYIQSGNVLVVAPGRDDAAVAAAVEQVLASSFAVETVVVAVGADALRGAVASAPPGFGSEPDSYHYDAAFLHPQLTSAEALGSFGIREGVDTAWAGDGVVYFRRLSAQRARTKMTQVLGSPAYRYMTIRNWRTTTRLAEMLDGA